MAELLAASSPSGELYSHKNEPSAAVTHTTAWMILTNIMWSKKIKTHKTPFCTIPFMQSPKVSKTMHAIRNQDTDYPWGLVTGSEDGDSGGLVLCFLIWEFIELFPYDLCSFHTHFIFNKTFTFLKSFLGAEMSCGEGEEKNKTDPFLKMIYLVTTNEQRGKELS